MKRTWIRSVAMILALVAVPATTYAATKGFAAACECGPACACDECGCDN